MQASNRDSYREAMDNPTNQADANMEASAPSLGSKFFKFMKIFVLGVCVFLYDIYSKIYHNSFMLKLLINHDKPFVCLYLMKKSK